MCKWNSNIIFSYLNTKHRVIMSDTAWYLLIDFIRREDLLIIQNIISNYVTWKKKMAGSIKKRKINKTDDVHLTDKYIGFKHNKDTEKFIASELLILWFEKNFLLKFYY